MAAGGERSELGCRCFGGKGEGGGGERSRGMICIATRAGSMNENAMCLVVQTDSTEVNRM